MFLSGLEPRTCTLQCKPVNHCATEPQTNIFQIKYYCIIFQHLQHQHYQDSTHILRVFNVFYHIKKMVRWYGSHREFSFFQKTLKTVFPLVRLLRQIPV